MGTTAPGSALDRQPRRLASERGRHRLNRGDSRIWSLPFETRFADTVLSRFICSAKDVGGRVSIARLAGRLPSGVNEGPPAARIPELRRAALSRFGTVARTYPSSSVNRNARIRVARVKRVDVGEVIVGSPRADRCVQAGSKAGAARSG